MSVTAVFVWQGKHGPRTALEVQATPYAYLFFLQNDFLTILTLPSIDHHFYTCLGVRVCNSNIKGAEHQAF